MSYLIIKRKYNSFGIRNARCSSIDQGGPAGSLDSTHGFSFFKPAMIPTVVLSVDSDKESIVGARLILFGCDWMSFIASRE